MRVLVTGARGFVGRNLCCALKNIRDARTAAPSTSRSLPSRSWSTTSTRRSRAGGLLLPCGLRLQPGRRQPPKGAIRVHGGNFGFASTLLDALERHGNRCPVMLSSSAQASLSGRFEGSVYGESKLAGEGLFREYSERTGAPVLIYRFPNLYGKWCRPRYNSAVATFCDAIANGRPYTVNDPSVELELLYIDDLVDEMLGALLGEEHRCGYEGLERVEGDEFCYVPETDVKSLGEIVHLLDCFRDSRETLSVPDLTEGSFSKKLWSTFLSYYEPGHFAYSLKPNHGRRAALSRSSCERPSAARSPSTSRGPGITKGNHWHMSKWERFLVVSGTASIKLRKVGEDSDGNPFPVDEYIVSGSDMRAVEMIPGYTHSITNLSDTEDLVTVMWANEPFDPESPDTYYEEV